MSAIYHQNFSCQKQKNSPRQINTKGYKIGKVKVGIGICCVIHTEDARKEKAADWIEFCLYSAPLSSSVLTLHC